jgi:immune inhibitor A
MRSKVLLPKLIFLLVAFLVFAYTPLSFAMPPNEAALMRSFEKAGKIPAKASYAEKARLLRSLLMPKISGKSTDPGNPMAIKRVQDKEKKGVLYNPGIWLNKTKNYNILVILVEFAGGDGPLHNQIPQPSEEDNTSFWVPDFSKEHYQEMLFSRKPGVKSMANYYYAQSGGAYSVTGYVTDWIQLPYPESYYGADSEDDHDNANGPVWRIVVDAVNTLGDSINWDSFDKEDPYDLDYDGNYEEPDGYIDHVMIIHAGAGQEAGGGAQGDDAIWSHSWWVDFGSGEGPGGLGGVKCGSSDKWVGPYTIEPEDGTIGVFCHEFGHDIGLPDVYDTIYSGEESAGFWTLMSSGSWLGDKGKALGTSPSSMSIWEKYVLGWANPTVVSAGQRKLVNLLPTNSKGFNSKAVRINLPSYAYLDEINTPHSGNYEWYSGRGDMINHTLELPEFDLTAATSAELSFYTWYRIEEDWDYGYVEVSVDGGEYAPIPGNITTDYDPNGNNDGNGITGASDWTNAVFDLSSFAGQKIKIRFRYETDQYVNEEGWTIDDIKLVVDREEVYFDDVESGNPGYVSNGWIITNGAVEKVANHYYILEYRTATGFDTSMKNWYNFVDYSANYAEFFEANPGVLMWYRNMRFNDNWVGLHPWQGFLLLVDSHPQLITAAGSNELTQEWYGYDVELPFRTRIQLYDAAFSKYPAKSQTITSWYGFIFPTVLPSLSPVTSFDDSRSWIDTTFYDIAAENEDHDFYWGVVTSSMNSVLVPKYGLKWYLRGMDYKGASILVDARSIGTK